MAPKVAALEREKHVAVQSTREAAVEETKALEAAHEHRVAQLREAHAAEVCVSEWPVGSCTPHDVCFAAW